MKNAEPEPKELEMAKRENSVDGIGYFDRRRLVASALGFGFAAPAFAQSRMTASPKDAGAACAARSLSSEENVWMEQTLTIGSVALKTSQIAIDKAQRPDVKQFAKFEADEQTVLGTVLKGMVPEGSVSGRVNADKQNIIQALEQTKAGPDFDRQYIDAQLDGHRKLKDVQDNLIKSRAGENALPIAQLALSRIDEHITMLEDLQKNHDDKKG